MILKPEKQPSLYLEPQWRTSHAFLVLGLFILASYLLGSLAPLANRPIGIIMIYYIIMFICFFLGPLYIACIFFKQPPQALGFQDKPLTQGVFKAISWGAALYFLVILIRVAIFVLFPNFISEEQQVTQIVQGADNLFDLAMLVFGVTILVPVAEELFFRAFLFSALEKRWGIKLAAVVSSLIFALMHEPSVYIPIFFGGLGFALMYAKYRDITMNMIAHATWNSIAIALTLLIQ